jgi:hypothetical protein
LSGPSGPMRQVIRVAGPWQIIGEQQRTHAGAPGRYDVYALHTDGERVPNGPNMHDDPAGEIDRLERVIDWPASSNGTPCIVWDDELDAGRKPSVG